LGKSGVPSAKTHQKKSRIDLVPTGFNIHEHVDDRIAKIDKEARTLTITIDPQPFRPLGAYKALVKAALTLMPENDLANVSEALRWLRSADLTTDRVDDGTQYTCIRSWTPGPAPIPRTRALLLRRRRPEVAGPAYIFMLAFGNLSFQIVVPAPRQDRQLIGQIGRDPDLHLAVVRQVLGTSGGWTPLHIHNLLAVATTVKDKR
jgi:hypothetical protein